MNLEEFAKDVLGSSSNTGGRWDSPKFEAVNNALGGYHNGSPTLVTTAWQTLLESPDLSKKLYPKAVQAISAYPALSVHLEKYILCLGDNKFCMLVFDPTITTDEPVYIDASKNNTRKSINSGFGIWRSKMNSSILNQQSSGVTTKSINRVREGGFDPFLQFDAGMYNEATLNSIEPQAIQYGINNAEWPMIICKPPQKIYTCLCPTEPHKVVIKEGELFKSLAGVYTTNNKNEFGATVCLHSFPNSYVELEKTRATVHGISGTVISSDNISDSCFVRLDESPDKVTGIRVAKGPLLGVTPREFEKCSFVNRDGQHTDTNITGWSPDIMYYNPYNQVKVLTNPITNPGDSGSALTDTADNVLGFSFYRTEINAVKEFSAWIWAASVFKAHNLNS